MALREMNWLEYFGMGSAGLVGALLPLLNRQQKLEASGLAQTENLWVAGSAGIHLRLLRHC